MSNVSCPHSIEDFIKYDGLSDEYQSYLTYVSKLVEPQNFSEAVRDESWTRAMQEDLRSLEQNKTWIWYQIPLGKSIIGCKWVNKLKYKFDGSLAKARLVAKGYNQK